MNPQFPIYIPSKGRFDSRLTMRELESIGVPYRVIIEEQEYRDYAAVIDKAKLLVLDPQYQRSYDARIILKPGESCGSGPARNFAWDHAVAEGAPWHWVVDDNIRTFYRLNRNMKNRVADGTIFRCMEDFVQRYKNIAMAGPQYEMFVPRKKPWPPFWLNTRIFSCNLIRSSAPFRWRCRYNEDLDLSLRMLKGGWCTILFNAFLQKKIATQKMKGGNTEAFYASEGTLPKSRMIVDLHPDVARIAWRYGRWHHHVDFGRFKALKLIRQPGLQLPSGSDNYGMQLSEADHPRL